MEQKYIIDGFEFYSEEDAKAATEELAKVHALNAKIDVNNLVAMKAVYLKAVEQNIFETQIGIAYLKNLQNYLISKGVLGEHEKPVPITYTKNSVALKNQMLTEEYDALRTKMLKDYDKRIDAEKTKAKKAQETAKNRTIFCVVLAVMVAVMFVISLTGKNPTILNYKSAITNQYSEWEQNLTEREKVIREKESQLGITYDSSQN